MQSYNNAPASCLQSGHASVCGRNFVAGRQGLLGAPTPLDAVGEGVMSQLREYSITCNSGRVATRSPCYKARH